MSQAISDKGRLMIESIADDPQAFGKKKGRPVRVDRGGPSIEGKVISLHRPNVYEGGGE